MTRAKASKPGRARRLLAMLSLVWLNLAMLPCTMAATDVHDCPNCPTNASDDTADAHASHHGGHHDHAPVDDSKPHCGFDTPDCCELDDLRVEDRGGKFDTEPKPISAAVDVPGRAADIHRLAVSRPAIGPPRSPTGAVRLHAFNCVYRD